MADSFYFEPQNVKILGPTFTVDTLPTATPELLGYYARVSDLFGEKTDLVLCYTYNGLYGWQPVRPFWARTATPAQLAQIQAGTFTYMPLKTPSLLRIPPSFTLTANRTMTVSPIGAWPGTMFQVAMDGTLGLFGLTIAGLDLGNTLSVLLNGRPSVYYDGAAYQKI